MHNRIKALLITGGHWFEEEPFFEMISALQLWDDDVEIDWTHAAQPEAQAFFTPEKAAEFDVFVCYDMPGVTYTGGLPRFKLTDPPEAHKTDFLNLLNAGKPFVFLHHAIASWPSWPEYAEIVGGSFQFVPAKLRGKIVPGSGYRFNVPQEIKVLDTEHPIVTGFDANFKIQDEVYMYTVFEDDITPLLRNTNFEFTPENFRSGGDGFKEHPGGSNLVGWTKTYGNSPIAYIMFGHGPQVYYDKQYRSLIVNSIKWAVSKEATDWLRQQHLKAEV
ncbi:ThuA domain-containing protein [Maribacter sp. 2210JD10-5]|uniref:ThuA domain-containing protein n=1 Tax=Maribacter sp. 2210JD10-5 TaxID=3386272 RepID=UPI0039BCCB29